MSSAVEISDRARSRLKALQEEIEKLTGREVSQREVLERAVEREYDSKEAIIESFHEEGDSRPNDEMQSLSEDEIAAFFSGTSDWGFETSEEEIDEILYGK